MATLNRPRLRNALRRLRAVGGRISGDYDSEEIAQEMLDFLAVLAGVKPVFLHGRALADPAWLGGVVDLATGEGLRVLQGPCWNVLPPGEEFPAWYADCIAEAFAPHRPFYICRSAVAAAVEAVNATGGRPTIEEEARLLGYPACCVAGHHLRATLYHRLVIARIEEAAAGDPGRLPAIYAGEIDLAPRDDMERVQIEAAYDIVQTPFGSWNACAFCQQDDEAPSIVLSAEYEALAWEIDHALHDLLVPREEPILTG